MSARYYRDLFVRLIVFAFVFGSLSLWNASTGEQYGSLSDWADWGAIGSLAIWLFTINQHAGDL